MLHSFCLYQELEEAYQEYITSTEAGIEPNSLEDWCKQNSQPMFLVHSLAVGTKCIDFVRSIRTGNFDLYVQSLTRLVPWFHLRDHPSLYMEFVKGHFTESPAALRRWMVSGPEMARLINDFEASVHHSKDMVDMRHHEQRPRVQKSFLQDMKALKAAYSEHKDFVKEHLVDRSKQLDDVIKKNLLCLFSTPTKRQKIKAQAIY